MRTTSRSGRPSPPPGPARDPQDRSCPLFPDGSITSTNFSPSYLKDPLPLGETRFLLIEIPHTAPVEFVKETCYRITCGGYTPLIAHPERCHLLDPKFQDTNRKGLWGSLFNSKLKTQNSEPADNSLLAYLQEIECKFQGNLGSFAGRYGERVRQAAERLREAGVYTHFGSDAHVIEHMTGFAIAAIRSVNPLSSHSSLISLPPASICFLSIFPRFPPFHPHDSLPPIVALGLSSTRYLPNIA